MGHLSWDDGGMECLCGDPATFGYEPADSECLFYELGYEWCPECEDHHRPPVCVAVIPGEVRDVYTYDGPLGLPPDTVVVYGAGFPETVTPQWTPFRDRIPRAAKCYRLASGAQVHVKPGCRC